MKKLSRQVAVEINQQIRSGLREQRRGHLEKARQTYLEVIQRIFGDHEPVVDSFQAGVVMHQMGSIHAMNRNAHAARDYFIAARKNLRKDNNSLGLARLLRDWGNFELIQGNLVMAERRIKQARDELKKPDAGLYVTKEALEIERAVTRGFLERVNLVRGNWPADAMARLRQLDTQLEAYGLEPVYQLANLGWIIDGWVTDTDHGKIERRHFTEKAIKLAAEVGNIEKQREYQALLIGGEPLRWTYRRSNAVGTRLGSFGKYFLNGLVQRFI